MSRTSQMKGDRSPQGDQAKLQGAWKITSFEMDGQTMSAGTFEDAQIVIERDAFTSLGMGAPYDGRFELDETKKPKAFDLVITGGHAAGTRNLGIYELEGDRWTICLATRGPKRPATFATKAGTGFALETLERAG